MDKQKLNTIAKRLVEEPKGILAADESTGTIEKRFDQINLESNFENRRKYRDLLFSTNQLEKYISGVILFDETIKQDSDQNTSFVNLLKKKEISVGIKVDSGAKTFIGSEEEKITEGLDGLSSRIENYKELGAEFTKWRAVITIGNNIPSKECIYLNSIYLSSYARIVQRFGLVPIVEPEVLMDGNHDINKCLDVTSEVLQALFQELKNQGVYLGGILLKPNMVISGKECKSQANSETVAKLTVKCLTDNVPSEVPGVVFLSGGQSNELATEHLNLMNKFDNLPFKLSFSYGRALQHPAISSWLGKDSNVKLAQDALYKRSELNSLATLGKYNSSLEENNI